LHHVTAAPAAFENPLEITVSLTAIIVTVVLLIVGAFTGLLRPTGLLSPKARTGLAIRTWFRVALPGLLILVALATFWTAGYRGAWYRLQLGVEGTVIARQDFPPTVHTHGPTTLYRLRRNDGSVGGYIATTSDASLPRTIPVGTAISKHKWDLFYLLDGKRIDDFPLVACLVALAAGIASLIGAIALLARERVQSTRAGASA
jgi:hypothetical protein